MKTTDHIRIFVFLFSIIVMVSTQNSQSLNEQTNRVFNEMSTVINEEQANIEATSVEPSHPHHHHHHHHRNGRKRPLVCGNGKAIDGICKCDLDYIGKHCEKKKQCKSYRRYRNGSCPECLKGYQGVFCENIICYNGKVNLHFTECSCDEPYSGLHCDELETRNIYSYYNRKVFLLGPLGAISLIPMCLLYMGCEYFAKKRQVKRVGLMMEGQNINVKNRTLESLLNKM